MFTPSSLDMSNGKFVQVMSINQLLNHLVLNPKERPSKMRH